MPFNAASSLAKEDSGRIRDPKSNAVDDRKPPLVKAPVSGALGRDDESTEYEAVKEDRTAASKTDNPSVKVFI